MKKREFRNLRQGGRTVGQYVEEFRKLARYAPDDIATDAFISIFIASWAVITHYVTILMPILSYFTRFT